MTASLALRSRLLLPLLGALLVAVLSAALVAPVSAQTTSGSVPAAEQQLDAITDEIGTAAAAGNWSQARAEWSQFQSVWRQHEDSFHAQSDSGYASIEARMRDVSAALRPAQPNPAEVERGLDGLRSALAPFASAQPQSGTSATAPAVSLSGLVSDLDAAIAAAQAGDASGALAAVQRFQNGWPSVEGQVQTRDPAAYTRTEDRMAEAESDLQANPPRSSQAVQVLGAMRGDLQPLAAAPTQYGPLDAAVILLREGLEAMLVVAALLAFLSRSGHPDQRRWIWGGAAAGILASVALALVLERIFAAVTGGVSREIVEGATGILAAVLLLYVSYWLHSKSNINAWQKFVRARTAAAMAGGSLLSLSFVSFLSVFREGAETTLFYMGMASSISLPDLLLGIGLGALALVVLGALMTIFELKIPLRPFFLVSSLLLYYLAFKFVGMGVHSLQVAGVLPASPVALPSIDAVGFYPTWETLLPQALLLLLGAAVIWWSRRHAEPQGPPSPGSGSGRGAGALGSPAGASR